MFAIKIKKEITSKSLMQSSPKVIPMHIPNSHLSNRWKLSPYNITFLRPTDKSTCNRKTFFFPIDTPLLNKTIVFPICNITILIPCVYFFSVSFIYAFGIHIILSLYRICIYKIYMRTFFLRELRKGIAGRMIWH